MKSKYVQACLPIAFKGIQCDMDKKEVQTLRSVTTQCNLDFDKSYVPMFLPQPHSPSADSQISLDDEVLADQAEDFDYVPEDDNPSADEWESDIPSSSSRKFLVFEEQLMQLFEVCRKCAQPAACHITSVTGTLIQVKQDCPHCKNSWTWDSQPFVRDVPAGNLNMSAAILFPEYVQRLVERVMDSASKTSIREILQEQQEAPPPLCSDFDKPDKEDMIRTMKSRYMKK